MVMTSKKYCNSVSEDVFILAKSVDIDEMMHYTEFHLGLHCLLKGSLLYKGLIPFATLDKVQLSITFYQHIFESLFEHIHLAY